MADLLKLLLYTTISAVSLCIFIIKFSLSYWKKRGILHEKPKFLYGNLKGVGSQRHVAMAIREIYQKYKSSSAPFIGFYAFIRPMVLVMDLNLSQRILEHDARYFADRGFYSDAEKDPLSANLMQLDGSQYQQLQPVISHAFKRESIEAIYPTLLRVATKFSHSLHGMQRESRSLSINCIVEGFNIDVISLLVFGMETESIRYRDTELHRAIKQYQKTGSGLRTFLLWSYPSLMSLFGIREHDEAIDDYFFKEIANRIKDRDVNGVEPRSTFFKIFADLKRRCLIDNKQVTTQCFSFISHGLGAFNSTLTFCLYELALHDEIQNRARKEIKSALEENPNYMDDINKMNTMQYIKQILYETLRKYSPYSFLVRETVADYEVPNSVFLLQKSNSIIIPIDAIHHDPKIFPEPERFDPARFDPSEIQQRNLAIPYAPFGAGGRSCIASYYAKLHMLLFLVTILKDYKISPCAETPIPIQFDNRKMNLTPINQAIKLRFDRI